MSKMIFRVVRDKIRETLAQCSNGEFDVIGAQKRAKSAEEVQDTGRLVEVFYSRGDFPKSGGSIYGPTKHNFTFRVDLTVSKASEMDVDTINDPLSTAAEVARAIAAGKESDLLADESMDEFFDLVYQILMDARNVDFGLDLGVMASRWVSSLEKNEPIERGNLTVLTGTALLTGSASEPVEGYTAVEIADPVIDATIEVSTDDVENSGQAGVETGA